MNADGHESRALRWSHLFIVLIVQLLALGFIYGSLKFQVESNSQRIEKLEEQTQGFKETKEEILRRLDRLENKLDLVINRTPKR
jgi:cell division protein FtsB